MTPYQAYNIFKAVYLRNVGRPYIETKGRDLNIMKMILKDVKAADFEDLVHLYFKKREQFYSPVFFKTSINELVQKKIRQDRDKRQPFKNPEEGRWI